MEASQQPPQRPRVQRKGRFTITEISPGSPQDTQASAVVFQDADAQASSFDDVSGEGDYDAGVAVAVAVGEALAHNQALTDTSVVVVQQQEQIHVQDQQREFSSSPPQAPTTPLLQPQSPEEDVILHKTPVVLVAAAPSQDPPSLVVMSAVATDPVVEPEPSPVIAPIEVHEPQQQQQHSPVLVDHVFIEYDNDSSDSDTIVQSPPPALIDEAPQQQQQLVRTLCRTCGECFFTQSLTATLQTLVVSSADSSKAEPHHRRQH